MENLTNIKIVNNIKNASDSLILSGMYLNQQVIIKVSPQLKSHENSLENERNIYMMFKNELKDQSPHICCGLFQGSLDDNELFLNPQNPFYLIRNEWLYLKLNYLYDEDDDLFHLIYMQGEYYEDEAVEDRFRKYAPQKYNQFCYIVTPLLSGQSLKQFIKNTITLPNEDEFDKPIMIQMAQVLIYLKSILFMHNDLHASNIFIEEFQEPIELHYSFPYKCSLKTKYKIMIFDYNHSGNLQYMNTSVLNYGEKCLGESNNYRDNWDWYTFIAYFRDTITNHHQRPIPFLSQFILDGHDSIFSKNNGREGFNTFAGRAALCTSHKYYPRINKYLSQTCNPLARRLDLLTDPLTFFFQHMIQE